MRRIIAVLGVLAVLLGLKLYDEAKDTEEPLPQAAEQLSVSEINLQKNRNRMYKTSVCGNNPCAIKKAKHFFGGKSKNENV